MEAKVTNAVAVHYLTLSFVSDEGIVMIEDARSEEWPNVHRKLFLLRPAAAVAVHPLLAFEVSLFGSVLRPLLAVLDPVCRMRTAVLGAQLAELVTPAAIPTRFLPWVSAIAAASAVLVGSRFLADVVASVLNAPLAFFSAFRFSGGTKGKGAYPCPQPQGPGSSSPLGDTGTGPAIPEVSHTLSSCRAPDEGSVAFSCAICQAREIFRYAQKVLDTIHLRAQHDLSNHFQMKKDKLTLLFDRVLLEGFKHGHPLAEARRLNLRPAV